MVGMVPVCISNIVLDLDDVRCILKRESIADKILICLVLKHYSVTNPSFTSDMSTQYSTCSTI